MPGGRGAPPPVRRPLDINYSRLAARAIREKKAVVSKELESNPNVVLGKKYVESGIRSMAILPLIVADEAVGVSTVIKLAHSLKLKVVAEGVETEEQSRLLRLLSRDEMQGLLFSQPVPSEIFETKYLAPLPAG